MIQMVLFKSIYLLINISLYSLFIVSSIGDPLAFLRFLAEIATPETVTIEPIKAVDIPTIVPVCGSIDTGLSPAGCPGR